MIRRPPRSTRTDTLFPYTTLFRSELQRQLAKLDACVGEAEPVIELKPFLRGAADTGANGLPRFQLNRVLRGAWCDPERSEEHTSELQSLMRISYAVFCLKKKKKKNKTRHATINTQHTI